MFYRVEYGISEGGAKQNRMAIDIKQESQMDMIMNDVNTNGIINIEDFRNSRYVSYNENDLNYCTSLSIELPTDTEMTPIQLKGVEMVNESIPESEGQLVPFKVFNDGDPDGLNSKIQLNTGESAVIITEDNDKEESGIFHVYNPNVPGSKNKIITLLEKVKYTVFAASDTVGEIAKFGLKCYDLYNKITMGIPRWILPLSMAAAETDEYGNEIVTFEDLAAEDSNVDINNSVKLPFKMYDLIW